MKVRAKAPLRLGLAGGGTDVSPYSELFGGCVLNATIDMYAYCTIELLCNGYTVFDSKDLGKKFESPALARFELEGDLILHKAIYNKIVLSFNDGKPISLNVTTYSDAPPGSGLGSSSTMVVAILRAYQELFKFPIGEYDCAHLAYKIERVDCGLVGGKQDQYAATFGGFNFIEFYQDKQVIVNPLHIHNEIVNELECNILLYYTGLSRESTKIIEDQVNIAKIGNNKPLEAMHRVKQTTVEMKEALLKFDIQKIAKTLKDSWLAKKQTSKLISNPKIEKIYETAMDAGANSAKISGAGGGGFMMLFVRPACRFKVIDALRQFGGAAYRFHFTNMGMEGWTVKTKQY